MAKSEYIITDQERIACEYFVVSNNKRASYALWRAVIGRTKEIAEGSMKSQAVAFFQRENIIDYVTQVEDKMIRKYAGATPSGEPTYSDSYEDPSYDNLLDMSKDEIRDIALKSFQEIMRDPESSPSDRISATSKIVDITNSKEKDNKNDMNEANKLIHYFLPADICTGCPNVSKIYEEHGYPATQKEIEEAFYNNKNAKKTKSEEDYEE